MSWPYTGACHADCECEECKRDFPSEFRTCMYCGAQRYWENVSAVWNELSESKELEGYVCWDCEATK